MPPDPWAEEGAQPGGAGGYLSDADFRNTMDATFGKGKWREGGGFRSQAREAALRAQGAGTVAAGHISPHSLGDPSAPGAHDITVDGLTADQVAARIKAREPDLFAKIYPEAAQGGQGAHVHLATAPGTEGGDPWGEGTADPWAEAKPAAAAPKGDFLDEAGRVGRSLVGGVVSGAGKLLKSVGELGDVYAQAQAQAAAQGVELSPTGQPVLTPPSAQSGFGKIAQEHQPVVSSHIDPWAEAVVGAGDAIAPANRSGLESFAHGAGEMVPAIAAAVANPAAGAAAFGAQGYGQAHDEAQAAGADEGTAQTAGLENAAIQGGLGMTPVGDLTAPLAQGIKAVGLRVAARLGLNVAGDATLGAAMQTGSNIVAQQNYDPKREWYDQVPQAAAMMAGGGILIHGTHEALGGAKALLRRPEAPPGAPPITPDEMPETNAIRAYAGKGPVEAEAAAPLEGETAAPAGAAGGRKPVNPIAEGDYVLIDSGRNPVHGQVVGDEIVTGPAGEPQRVLAVKTPLGVVSTPADKAVALPGDFEGARIAAGAPLEQMPQAIADVAEIRRAAPKGYSLFQAMRDLGGIRTRDADGSANDVAALVDGKRLQPGVVNNKTGMSPDAMREALQQRGWFGDFDQTQAGADQTGAVRPGDDIESLHEAIRTGLTKRVTHPSEAGQNARRADLEDQLQRAGASITQPLPEAAAKLAAWRGEQVKTQTPDMALLRKRAEDLGVRSAPDASYDEVLGDVVEAEARRGLATAADADHYESLIDAELTPEEHEWLAAGARGAEGELGPSFEPEAPASYEPEPVAAEGAGQPGEGAGGGGEDQTQGGQPEDVEAVNAGLRNGARQVSDARRMTVDRFDIKKNKGAPSTWTAEQQDFYKRQLAEIRRAEAKGNLPENLAANDYRNAEMERAAEAKAPAAVESARAELEAAQAALKANPGSEGYAERSAAVSDADGALHRAEIAAGLRTEREVVKMPGKAAGLGGTFGNALIVERFPDGLWRAGANYSLPNGGGGGPAFERDPGFATRKEALNHAADKMRDVLDQAIEVDRDNAHAKAAKAVKKWLDKEFPVHKATDVARHAAVLEKIAQDYERLADERNEPFFRENTAAHYRKRREEVLAEVPGLADLLTERTAARDARPLSEAMAAMKAQLKKGAPASERQNVGGETVDQQLLAGGERSAQQAAKAREGPLRAKVAQEKPGGLFGAPEPEAGDLFGERDPWSEATPSPGPENRASDAATGARSAVEPKGSGYGERNKLFTREAADQARAKLDQLRNRLSSGIDPEMIHAGITLAGYHVEAGARKFGDFAHAMLRDLGEWSAPYLKMWYNALRDYPEFDNAGMTPVDKLPASVDDLVREHVLGRSADLEQGGEGTAPADADGAGSIPPGSGGIEPGAGGAGDGADQSGLRPQGGLGLPDGGAAPLGEGGPGDLFAGSPGAVGRPAGGGEPSGGDVARDTGIQPDRLSTEDLDRTADEAAHLEPVSQEAHPYAESSNAPPVSRELEAALPTLFPEQRSDVAFAEARFEEPDGHGVMFTNGTGTGKTFTGGGILKRFHDRGETDVLVIAPTQGILTQWKEAAEKLGVPLKILEDMSSHGGKGPVATTYANFGQNRTLADREWNLIIPDESHTLSSDQTGSETNALQTLRAITNHPDRLRRKAEMQLRDQHDKVIALRSLVPKGAVSGPAWDKWLEAQHAFDEVVREKAKEYAGLPRSKVAFLSATPFAYDKSVDYAQGYLFDYPATTGRGYNDPADGRDAFMIQHFGYRMRYGKLTKPEAAVESDVMERQFHEWLRRTGALSGRVLNVDKDYDRKFVLIDNGVGNDIDKALDFLQSADDGKFRPFYDVVRKKFDYLSRQRLLEAIKARHAVDIIGKHLDLGRKVVVFHNYNEGGGFNPFSAIEGVTFVDKTGKRVNTAAMLAEFHERNPYVKELEEKVRGLPSPLDQLKRAYPDALIYNGTVPKAAREQAKQSFNQDGGRHNLIVVQSEAGQAGISLHDTTGKHQRVILNLGMPGRPTAAIQQEGRIYRIGQASDAVFRYMNTGTNWERHAFSTTIAQRAGTAENLALGDQARTMRESFINAFLDSAPYPPARGEGKGGKRADRELARAMTDYQKAKSYYFAESKKGGRRDSREGKDYFATPEPVGLKMVEWADLRPGEKVLEPSAGHGAIARFFPETADRTLVEPSARLASRAALSSPGANVLEHPFEDLNAVNKYDAVVMNPPFGHAGSTAIAHVAKAANHLKDGGRIVALIPRGATDEKFDRFMESPAAKGLYEIATVDLPTSTFERAGTKVSTRIVVLEKQLTDAGRDRLPQTVHRDYSSAEKIGDLFDRLEDSTLKERVRQAAPPVEETRTPAEVRRDTQILADTPVRFDTDQVKHGKTGADVFVATARDRMASDEYKAVLALAKKHGGFYSSFRGGDAVPGFQFPTEAQRAAFMDEAASSSAPKFQREGPRDLFEGLEPLTPRPAAGPFAKPAPDRAKAHFDQNHADLYRLSQKVGSPDQRAAEAQRLATEMGQFMDWSEAPQGERAAMEKTGSPTARGMMKAAVDYRRQFDAFGKHSQYDPDAYHDVMQRWYESQGGERPKFQRDGQGAPVFYSAVERLVDSSPMQSASAEQWKATLRNAPGIKAEEISWMGVSDWLDLFGAGAKVDKAALQAFVRQHGVEVQEVVLDRHGDKSAIQARADELYGDHVQRLTDEAVEQGEDPDEAEAEATRHADSNWGDYFDQAEEELGAQSAPQFSDWTLPGGQNYHELLLTLPAIDKPPATHWETDGVMAHVRFNERMSPDGKKVLFVEEIQSDWHQKGRDESYRAQATEEERARATAARGRAESEFVTAADNLRAALEAAPHPAVFEALAKQHGVVAVRLGDLSPFAIVELGQRVVRTLSLSPRDSDVAAAIELQEVHRVARHAELAAEEARQAVVRTHGDAGIPDAPFKSSWPSLVMKRVIRWAVDNNFDRVAWTTGEQQADRYDLTKHINHVSLHDNASGGISDASLEGPFNGGNLSIYDAHRNKVLDRFVSSEKELHEHIGKELTDRLLAQEPRLARSGGLGVRERRLEGLDVKTGGEGMKAFYDRNLVNITNDLIKKHGGKVERVGIDHPNAEVERMNLQAQEHNLARQEAHPDSARTPAQQDYLENLRRIVAEKREYLAGGQDQHGFDITPKLRDAVSGGQPLFQRPGEQSHVGFAGRGAHLVADLYGIPADREGPQAQAIGAVADLLEKVAPHARVKAFQQLRDAPSNAQDMNVTGATYRRGALHVIAWSLESDDPLRTASHEAVHALRNAGLFTDAEWRTLEKAAIDQDWMGKFNIADRYGDQGWEQELEESIADRFAHWQGGDGLDVTRPLDAVFAKIRDFLGQVRSAMRKLFGQGASAEDILRQVASGEVGRRAMGPAPVVDGAKFAREPVRDDERAPGSFINRILGRDAEAVGKRLARAATKAIPDPVLALVDEAKMGLSPMGSGSTRAQAGAKDFANELRTSAHQWGKLDEWLNKTFTREQQQKMWEAADQEGVLIRRGVTPGADEGLNRLTPEERGVVKNLQARADTAFDHAKDLGMVTGEGLESYVPRMVVEMTAGGPRILARSNPRQAARGGNLSTTTGQLKQRKYETVEETEGAAKEHFGKGAMVVRNIRTLGLATSRLERAIAGRTLVDKIKAMSKDAGADLVVEGGRPDPGAYFTLDHPALQRWGPKFITDEQTGKTVAAKDQNGDTVFEAQPIWISREFEGPLKAVLSTPTSGILRALGDLKGKMMSVIMYSPVMHNAVIWGKAIPADPRGVLSLQAYARGNAAKNDWPTMEEAMRAGLDPIGHRFFNQDVTSIAEGAQIVPGRSWTAQALAYVPGLFDRAAGERVKEAVDKVGDLWHNTFLWDRVADLQMGLYTHIRDQLNRQSNATGIKPLDAQRIAAHFANRYAGSLPQEAMSKLSRETANLMLFSRSFTLGNMAAYKDIVKGLPSDVRAQVLRDSGAEALGTVQGIARQKALGMLALDVGLSYVGLFMAAGLAAWLTHQKFQAPWDNEEDRQKRFLIGYQPDGTAVYGRLPTGKVGEELQDWLTEPRDILLRKLSPLGRLLYAVTANDKGFGRKLFLPNDPLAKNMGRVAWFALQGIAPVGQLQGASDAFTGAQDKKTALLQALAPVAGITISKGAPGGPAMGDYYQAKEAHDFNVQEAMPDIRRQIARGDLAGARAKMQELGIAPGLQSFYIRTARAPGSRLKGRTLADFERFATPEQKARIEKDRQAAASRAVTEDTTP